MSKKPDFDKQLVALNKKCGHDHLPLIHNGFWQYTGPFCERWTELVGDQREWWRNNKDGR